MTPSNQEYVVQKGERFLVHSDNYFHWDDEASKALRFNGDAESFTFEDKRRFVTVKGTLKGWLDADAYSDSLVSKPFSDKPRAEIVPVRSESAEIAA